jgi:primosomal protein N' (replication factor Y) (superfamily II helicase)
MTEYCEVAVPVPLDQLFTYKLDRGISSEAGARVLVPFRERRLIGIVTELHDRAPAFAAKNVLESLDESGTPALTEELIRLGRWISVYYLAPIG